MEELEELDIDFDFKKPEIKRKVRKKVTHNRHKVRRAFSELAVLDEIQNIKFKKGDAIHFISAGDVDSLSYFKAMIRKQKMKTALFSTWVIAKTDIEELEKMLNNKTIQKLDAYVGEIFPSGYSGEYRKLKQIIEGRGRVCVFRNHAKIFLGFGEKYDFVIESSANINTNPRTEQTTITISSGLAQFYYDYFSEITSIK